MKAKVWIEEKFREHLPPGKQVQIRLSEDNDSDAIIVRAFRESDGRILGTTKIPEEHVELNGGAYAERTIRAFIRSIPDPSV
jgi:hypothetical protein